MNNYKTHSDYKKAVENIYYWQYCSSTSFSAHLFNLMGRADINNLRKLKDAFYYEFQAWFDWQSSYNKTEFFKKTVGFTIPEGD